MLLLRAVGLSTLSGICHACRRHGHTGQSGGSHRTAREDETLCHLFPGGQVESGETPEEAAKRCSDEPIYVDD